MTPEPMTTPHTNCPNCGVTVLSDDLFCEECGTALQAEAIAHSDGCKKCGARPDAIDADGYCSNCGFRNITAVDRLVVTCSPHLGGASDPGLRHAHNEDYLALATVDSPAIAPPVYILVVCDGVSSSQTPELAAETAAQSTCTALVTALQHQVPAHLALTTAVADALTDICAIPYTCSADTDPPSATLVAAIVQGKTATIGWLGDSRAYWVSTQGSRSLTRDHSWVSEMVVSGQMNQTEAEQSPHAHAITRWLGADAKDDATPSIIEFLIPGAGYLLLCSDGLWNYTPDPAQLADLIHRSPSTDATEIAHGLVEFARSQGGHDNITAAVLVIG